MAIFNFLKLAVKDYKTVGALTPSSRFVVQRVIKQIQPAIKTVLEYGPGDGVMTREILKVLPEDGKLIAIEKSRSFSLALQGIGDKRFSVIYGDVLEVLSSPERLGIANVEAVVSGIPFLMWKSKVRRAIIAGTAAILNPGGLFLWYQNMPIPKSNKELKTHFSRVRWQFEPRNFLPYFIITAVK